MFLNHSVKRWLKYVTVLFMVVQLVDFTVAICEFFKIDMPVPEGVGIIISMVLTIWVFRRFLVDEFKMRDFDSYVLVVLFVLFNLNILLKMVTEEPPDKPFLYYIPILVLVLIPFYLFLRGELRKYLDILVFTIIVVYPLSQVYTLALKKFVAVAVSIYVIYVFTLMLREKEVRLKEVIEKLAKFDEVAVNQIKKLARKNREFYYVYLIIWLFIISDVILYLLPWESPYPVLGAHGFEVGLVSILSSVFFVIIVSYPVIHEYVKGSQFLAPIFILFLSYPTIKLSPVIIQDLCGVKIELTNLVELSTINILTPLIVFLIMIAGLKLVKSSHLNFEVNWLLWVIILSVSTAYIIVFIYSLYYHLIKFPSPNLILIIFLLGFFVFSITYLPYLMLREARKMEPNLSIEILFLLVLAMLFSYSPSAYNTLTFIFYLAFFSLRTIRIERILIVLYLLPLTLRAALTTLYGQPFELIIIDSIDVFSYYLITLSLAIFTYGIYSGITIPKKGIIIPKKYLKIFLLIPVFVFLSLVTKEQIPYQLTLTGISYLIILSGSEEVIFKQVMFDNMKTEVGRVATPLAFSFIHILTLSTLNYYIGVMTLPLFLIYLFSYQYITIRIYENNRNIIPFMILHASINVISIALGSIVVGNLT